jgi:hypothetical protein
MDTIISGGEVDEIPNADILGLMKPVNPGTL